MKCRKESEIQKAILHYLNLQPLTFAFKVSSTGIPDFKRLGGFRKNPNAGVADIIGCKNGKFFAFEVKSSSGKITDRQRNFLTTVCMAGGYEALVRSIADAEEAFNEI